MHGRLVSWLRDPETLKLALHVMLTAVMGWLSFDFALPSDMLALPSFRGFAMLATEKQWSALFLVAGLVGLVGLLTRRRWLRLACIAGLSTAHISIAYCFYLSFSGVPGAPVSTAVGIYSLIAAMGYLLLWVRVFER